MNTPPKGTIDYYETSGIKLKHIIDIIESVFEKKKILLNKYGDEAENKLIYELAEKTSEVQDENEPEKEKYKDPKYAMRYDLTIPFIHHIIEHGIKKIRRYTIGKVYRHDTPSITQGRF